MRFLICAVIVCSALASGSKRRFLDAALAGESVPDEYIPRVRRRVVRPVTPFLTRVALPLADDPYAYLYTGGILKERVELIEMGMTWLLANQLDFDTLLESTADEFCISYFRILHNRVYIPRRVFDRMYELSANGGDGERFDDFIEQYGEDKVQEFIYWYYEHMFPLLGFHTDIFDESFEAVEVDSEPMVRPQIDVVGKWFFAELNRISYKQFYTLPHFLLRSVDPEFRNVQLGKLEGGMMPAAELLTTHARRCVYQLMWRVITGDLTVLTLPVDSLLGQCGLSAEPIARAMVKLYIDRMSIAESDFYDTIRGVSLDPANMSWLAVFSRFYARTPLGNINLYQNTVGRIFPPRGVLSSIAAQIRAEVQ